jgi:glucosylceramidase
VYLDRDLFDAHDLRYIIPWIKRASQVAGKRIELYLTPWSPPAWMKSNGERNHGGRLLKSFSDAWAAYIASYLKAYETEGLPVSLVGVQNEPNASQMWDSCLFSAEEEHDFILESLSPALRAAQLEVPPIITIWDHNRERLFERVGEVYREDISRMVGAASFHWYSGDHHEQVALTASRYPDLLLIFSEGCIEYSAFSSDAQIAHAKHYAHQIIGDLNHGAHIWLDWNMVLAANGGPNHVGNYCDSPILCNLSDGTYQKRLSYYYIKHFSRSIAPGAVRIAHSLYTHELEATAWKNPDNSCVLVIHNPTDEKKQIHLRINGQITSFSVESESIMSLRW